MAGERVDGAERAEVRGRRRAGRPAPLVERRLGQVGPRSRNTSTDRALDVLLLFEERRLELSVAEIAERLRLPRSTVYRYVHSLRRYGFLVETTSGQLGLGPLVLRLAHLARKRFGLAEAALPMMRQLATSVSETVLLTALVDERVVCLERVDGSTEPLRIVYERGQELPLDPRASASATVLLAFSEPAQTERLLRTLARETELTGRGLDTQAAQHRLAEVRSDGYAVLGDDALCGIAAPVRTSGAVPLASLVVVGPSLRVPQAAVPTIVAAVTSAANTIAQRLNDIEGCGASTSGYNSL